MRKDASNMMSIYLCDDEPIWLERLNKAVTDYQIKSDWELMIVCQATSPEMLLQYLTKHTPMNGIYFLDIDFKSSMDGMDLAKEIRAIDSQASIIFVTTHDEMVMETFRLKLEVLDYIIKDGSPLAEQIHQCLHHLETKYMSLTGNTPENISGPVTVHAAGSFYTFFPQEIYYVETVKNTHKICLHLHSAIYHVPDSLSSLQARLGTDFIQCHKAYLVNIRHIKALDSVNRRILLDNGDCCPCSVRAWGKMVRTYRERNEL